MCCWRGHPGAASQVNTGAKNGGNFLGARVGTMRRDVQAVYGNPTRKKGQLYTSDGDVVHSPRNSRTWQLSDDMVFPEEAAPSDSPRPAKKMVLTALRAEIGEVRLVLQKSIRRNSSYLNRAPMILACPSPQ